MVLLMMKCIVVISAASAESQIIEGEYIVILKESGSTDGEASAASSLNVPVYPNLEGI